MHKFICLNNDGEECCVFYVDFVPAYEEAWCPNCGEDKHVSYLGEVNLEEVK